MDGGVTNPEQARYESVWGQKEYRKYSPSECHVPLFLAQAKHKEGDTVIEFGCGTGRAGLALANAGLNVTLLDFAANCLDDDVRKACEQHPEKLRFVQQDLLQPLPFYARYGYCCDVLEHIREEDVELALANVLSSAQHCFFSIATVQDDFGEVFDMGPLHLTVRPMKWWLEKIEQMGGRVHWQQEQINSFWVYCTSWKDAKEVIVIEGLNFPQEQVDEHIRCNIEAGWQQITSHEWQDKELVVVGGGPSINDEEEKIRELRAGGAGLVTLNGSYQWCIERGLVPSIQIVLDSRPFNARFTQPVTETTRYLIASQVHPDTLHKLPRDRTFLFHCGISEELQQKVVEKDGFCTFIPGGSTVMLRAFAILRLLGFSRLHVFGFDSCVNGSHHAYEQAENDGEPIMPVYCAGKLFHCTPWQLLQASEFRDVVGFLGPWVEMQIHGDGLIRHMVETGAGLSAKES